MSPILAHDEVVASGASPRRWMFVLHGIYGSGRNWASVARRFVRERPEWGAVLVDLRMHGASIGFEPPHTLERCAADLSELETSVGRRIDAILGHSFGGKVALVYAGLADPAPSSVWVVDSTPSARPPDGSAWMMLEVLRRYPGPFQDRAEAIAAVEAAGFATPVAQWMSINLVQAPEGQGMVWRLDPDDMEALMRDFFQTDAWRTVEEPPPGTRIHVVKASESSVLDEEACERLEAAGRATGGRVQLHRVEGGHWVNTENPDALQALLLEHME